MSDSAKKDWRELCAAVSSEQDSKKLESLVEELIQALDDRQLQSHVAQVQTPATNRSSSSLGQDGQDAQDVVMSLPPHNVSHQFKEKSSPLFCRICGKPVAIETCKTDGDGQALHEDCYVRKLRLDKDGQSL